jgi:hypothetical protein
VGRLKDETFPLFKTLHLMNITTDKAGAVSLEHILSKGFTVFKTIEGNDMGQMDWSIPQFTNGEITIEGGYWTWVIYDKNRKELFRGWWNTNDEFDKTISELTTSN